MLGRSGLRLIAFLVVRGTLGLEGISAGGPVFISVIIPRLGLSFRKVKFGLEVFFNIIKYVEFTIRLYNSISNPPRTKLGGF